MGADFLRPPAPQDAGHQRRAVLAEAAGSGGHHPHTWQFSEMPRDSGVISGHSTQHTRVFDTFDLLRNLAHDSFTNQKASADGREFRTAPLMGLGRIGPPFLHDARVYLSELTVDSKPAGTVTTNRTLTNAPLVVRNVDDALLAAIELHDLPAPDDGKTSRTPSAGCPVPSEATNVTYGLSPQDVICPPYASATSQIEANLARSFSGFAS